MASALNQKEIEQKLSDLNGWKVENDKLTKDFKFSNFRESVAFITRIAFEAEEAVHHPEIFNVYNKVSLSLSTHDAGGKITQKDIGLAKKIDEIHT
ncbi:MAG: 4a-hydroxytetrahydrobiopterin dehydratase [Balneolales bacterium]